MSDGVDVRPATSSDFDAAKSWLSSAGLPTADLTPEQLSEFLIAAVDGAPTGLIGLQRTGKTGLLRSLVVDPGMRSGGIGKQLVRGLELMARECGIAELWLLTTDADGYFMKLSYERRKRSEAPVEIKNTAEFSGLCPGDAILMSKSL